MQLKTSYSDIWKIALPVILGGVSQTIINVTDTLFLGRVSETALGASAVGGVFFFVLYMIGLGFTQGMQILIARKAGEKKEEEIGPLFTQGAYLIAFLSLFLLLFLVFFADHLMKLIIHDPKILEALLQFIHYRTPGLVFTLLILQFRAFFIGIGVTRPISWNMAVMAIINIVFNALLVFGKWGFPAMGIAGSALASSIAECCGALVFLYYIAKNKPMQMYGLLRFRPLQMDLIKRLTKLSMPIVFQNFSALAGWLVFFLVIEKTGERNLAVSNILRSLLFILMTPVWGFFAAANTMVSNVIGQGKSDDVMALVKKVCALSFSISMLLSLMHLLFPRFIISCFTDDPSLIEYAIGPLYLICAASVLFSVGGIFLAAVSGTGSTQASMFIEFISMMCYLSYIYFIYTRATASIEFYWTTEAFYWLFIGTLSFLYLRSAKWKGKTI